MNALNKSTNNLFNTPQYKKLTTSLVLTYGFFMLVYFLRGKLYELNNQFITLFSGSISNLIPSFIFTLFATFYLAPAVTKSTLAINNIKFLWFINITNIGLFSLIEYMHVVKKVGVWDNNDIIASFIGATVATIIYFKIRKKFI